ncbi:MAG: metallophosphoesterase [Planctomycetota bacterium]|nr:metallophosphoesterase [Planctomycetota bacterium]
MTTIPNLDPTRVYVESNRFSGLLFIGDPHVEGRTPGFRRDNYPETILAKLKWCIEYCEQQELQPILLGDIFDKPRDNPNWLIARMLDIFDGRCVPTIFGNHDCANPHLDENDSLTLLEKAGAVRLLDEQHLWACSFEGRIVLVGGSPYRYPIPEAFAIDPANLYLDFLSTTPPTMEHLSQWPSKVCKPGLVIWLTHHDLTFPNPHEAVVTHFNELVGIDYVINGHIHRRASADVVRGQTTWVNPGNIVRRSRSDSIRGHEPAVLRMDIVSDDQFLHYVNVPHQDATQVFHDLDPMGIEDADQNQSSFVTGLAMLQSRKTESGAGLMQFLKENVSQFETEVASEILKLAEDVLLDSNQASEIL